MPNHDKEICERCGQTKDAHYKLHVHMVRTDGFNPVKTVIMCPEEWIPSGEYLEEEELPPPPPDNLCEMCACGHVKGRHNTLGVCHEATCSCFNFRPASEATRLCGCGHPRKHHVDGRGRCCNMHCSCWLYNQES